MPKDKSTLFNILTRGGMSPDAATELANYLANNGDDPVSSYFTSQALAVGEEVFPRALVSANPTTTSGSVRMTFFTARKTEVTSQIRMYTGSQAAGATPTLCKMGLYSVAANNDLTLVGATASDTTLWAATFQRYSRPVVTPFQKIAGQRYAFAVLILTAATAPSLTCCGMNSGSGTSMALSPKLSSTLSGQSDLPASITDASVGNAGQFFYGEVLP